jgi:hypothetical protein
VNWGKHVLYTTERERAIKYFSLDAYILHAATATKEMTLRKPNSLVFVIRRGKILTIRVKILVPLNKI